MTLTLGAVAAQDVVLTPVEGEFHTVYIVAGRVVDGGGWPAARGTVEIEVTGIDGVRVPPFKVGVTCNGDFIGYFKLGTIEGRAPKVRATLAPPPGEAGAAPVTSEKPVDDVYRRTNFILKAPYAWDYQCPQTGEYWESRVTVWGRAIDGVDEPLTLNETTVYARPVETERVHMFVQNAEGAPYWPPDRAVRTDVRGDFLYSYIFEEPVSDAQVRLTVRNTTVNATYDPLARIAFVPMNVGLEPPRDRDTPPSPVAVQALTITAVALALAGAARGRRA